jgi:hypothetical protein
MNGVIVLCCCVAIIVAYPTVTTETDASTTESSEHVVNRTVRHIVKDSTATTGKTVKLFIRSRYLQIADDGTVNGTDNANSNNIIFKRFIPRKFNLRQATEDKMLLRNMKTCKYVCVSACGLMYSVEFPNDDCLLSETMTLGSGYSYMHKNRNSSIIHYVALDKHGEAKSLTQLKNAVAAKMIVTPSDDTRDECAPQMELDTLSKLQVPAAVACEKTHRGNIKTPKNFYTFVDEPTIYHLSSLDTKNMKSSASDEDTKEEDTKEDSSEDEHTATMISHTSTYTRTKFQCKF